MTQFLLKNRLVKTSILMGGFWSLTNNHWTMACLIENGHSLAEFRYVYIKPINEHTCTLFYLVKHTHRSTCFFSFLLRVLLIPGTA